MSTARILAAAARDTLAAIALLTFILFACIAAGDRSPIALFAASPANCAKNPARAFPISPRSAGRDELAELIEGKR